MSISVEQSFTNATEQLSESGVTGKIRSQYQLVEKESDQSFRFQPISTCDVCSDDNVLLLRITVKQNLETSEKRHKHRRALTTTQASERLRQWLFRHKFSRRTRKSRRRRMRPISRQ